MEYSKTYQYFSYDKEEIETWLEKLTLMTIRTKIQDDFKFEDKLGQGYFSSVRLEQLILKVVKATRKRDGQEFAIKCAKKETIRGA